MNRKLVEHKLETLGICPSILDNYDEPHRFYHNWNHIDYILSELDKRELLDNNVLFLAAIFHDIIYNPKNKKNEEDSIRFFKEIYKKEDEINNDVCQIISDTKNHSPSSELSKIFCEIDLNILNSPLDKLIEYENKIFKEYQFVDWLEYKTERIEVLRTLQNNNELEGLISYIETRKPKIAVYPGSFNPFHKGHYNILLKAEKIFDKIIIARGKNPEKKDCNLYNYPKELEFRQREVYFGLLTDFVKKLGYDVTIIRGLRNFTDLQYELTQYRFLRDINPDIKVVSIFCDKEYEHISSSAIKQLIKHGKHKKYLL